MTTKLIHSGQSYSPSRRGILIVDNNSVNNNPVKLVPKRVNPPESEIPHHDFKDIEYKDGDEIHTNHTSPYRLTYQFNTRRSSVKLIKQMEVTPRHDHFNKK